MDELATRLFGVELERLAPVFALVLARAAPLAWLAPWLGWRGTAAALRGAVAVVLAAALTPLALSVAPALPDAPLALVLLALREALVGAAFAVAVSVPLYALGWTGALVDRWRGAPSPRPESPLEALHLAAGVVLFVTLGGHRLALAAFAATLTDVPVGAGASAELAAFGLGAARIVGDALALAVAFAAPTALALVVLELVLGLHGRLAPSLRAFVIALPLRAALGLAIALIGLSALLPRLGPALAGSVEAASDLVRRGAP